MVTTVEIIKQTLVFLTEQEKSEVLDFLQELLLEEVKTDLKLRNSEPSTEVAKLEDYKLPENVIDFNNFKAGKKNL